MSICRREFLQRSLALGAIGATTGLTGQSAFAARHAPIGEGTAELFKKFDGNDVLLAGKYSGLAHVMDLAAPETLAWYPYGLTGMDMPIAHHIAAMPSSDPYSGFDFYQTFQPPMDPYVDENSLAKVPAAFLADGAGHAAALDKVTYKSVAGTAPAGGGAGGSATAACDAGQHVLGGGLRVDDPANANLLDDYPDVGDTAWTGRAYAGPDAAVNFTVYAICATI